MFFLHNLTSFAFFGDPFAFFDAPGAEGDGQPNPDGDNGNGAGADNGGNDAASGAGGAGKTFTQADVDRIVSERAKRAEETAVRSLLSKNKFEKVEDLEQFLADSRQKAEAELSEVERLKLQLENAPAAEAVEELQTTVKNQNKAIQGLVDAQIKALNVPEHVTKLLGSMTPLAQLEYINSNRDAFKPTPTPPNLNGGDKGSGNGKNIKKTVQQKYGIRRRNRS